MNEPRQGGVRLDEPAGSHTAAVAPANLRLNADELASLLCDAVRRRAWLDAYLFATGLNQIAEDYTHRDVLLLGTIGEHLLWNGGAMSTLAGRTAAVTASLVLDTRSRLSPSEVRAWPRRLPALVLSLAELAVAESAAVDTGGTDGDAAAIETTAETIRSGIDALPAALRDQTARPPACFHAFDLDVADVRSLTAEFARTRPERSRPLLVAGVRTSGSYLAPLCAALLRSEGYTDVRVLTLRPQHQLGRAGRSLVRRLAGRHGLALLLDDPPGSGRSVARAADQLVTCGLPRESIVLLLPLFGDRESLPRLLDEYPSVLLPSDQWAINAKLASEAVRRTLERLAPAGVRITAVEPESLEDRQWRRGHERRLFTTSLVDDGGTRTMSVLVEGVGIGYFGEHALTVARALQDDVPEVFGLEGGCLFRAWLPEQTRSCPPGGVPPDDLVAAVASYVATRRQRLRVPQDRTIGLAGEEPAWEVVSRILSRTFGRCALPSRLLLLDALARRILAVRRPSIVDGTTALSNWFHDERRPGRYMKVDFAKRSFWNLGLTCYDPVFDLVGAALSSPSDATGDALRSRYSTLTGDTIDEERWFLYELAQLWGIDRMRAGNDLAHQRECARSLQRYLARLFLADVTRSPDGPLCALDLDGVLETETLGFPGTTASGAMALRTLLAHGYRPVPVSGRSVGEVADRCRSYGLAGGVAEYGGAVYTTAVDRTDALLPGAERRALARVRADLTAREHIRIDDAYQYAVRAFTVGGHGRRRPLDRETAADVVRASGDPSLVRAIEGEGQTDFAACSVDKGTGVRALASRLGATVHPDRRVLAFAIGDTASDLPMLREAELAFAPSNATRATREDGVEALPVSYQAAVSVAVGRLVGHPPGGCPACRAPTLTPEATLLVTLLSAQEGGRVELARRFLRLRRLFHAAR